MKIRISSKNLQSKRGWRRLLASCTRSFIMRNLGVLFSGSIISGTVRHPRSGCFCISLVCFFCRVQCFAIVFFLWFRWVIWKILTWKKCWKSQKLFLVSKLIFRLENSSLFVCKVRIVAWELICWWSSPVLTCLLNLCSQRTIGIAYTEKD